MEKIEGLFDWLSPAWEFELFHLGENIITLGSLVTFILALTALFFIASWVYRLLIRKIFPRYNLKPGLGQTIAKLVQYLLIILGLVIIVQSSGIDLTPLGILFGALGVGIGFGLQNITNNFISGLIILFERPIKIGDRVELETVTGNVVSISARSTTVITNDNIAMIVPNSEFINSRVINWSLNDRNVRFNFPVGVSYKENPLRIKKLMLEVAHNNKGVLKKPEPDVLFDEFGDSSLNFNLRVWTSEYSDRPKVLKSQLYYAIFEKFKEHNIEIPFPQRDLHLKSGFGQPYSAEDLGKSNDSSSD
ncbi:MAG: mechanosensitive ion channel family protein [Bacteroidales bacterium]